MIIVAAGNTIQAGASAATSLTLTAFGLEQAAGVNAYKTLFGPVQLGNSVGVLYTVPASTTAFIKTIVIANTSGGPVTASLYLNGSTAAFQQASIPIPANGEAIWAGDGWKVIDANGNTLVASSTSVQGSRVLTAGAGLTGGGDLTADRTFNVIANADGSIVVNADDIQVGVLATDAQHGGRGGGGLHAAAVSGGANGFFLGTDKARLDAMGTASPPGSRQVIAGAGLTGGGDLSADRTFNVIANADGSLLVNANDMQVGVLATDAQHGIRGGGTQHAIATVSVAGFQAAADKAAQVNLALGWVNIMDFGADRTGVASSRTALTNAIAALPNGGVVFFPPGTYQLGNTNFNINTAHITLQGAARYATNIITSSTTEDIITLNQWYDIVQDLTFTGPGSGQVPTKTAGYAINTIPANASYSIVRRCTFTYQFNCVNLGNTLMVIDDAECRFFKNTAVAVTHNSDHQVNQLTCDNNPGALPTGAGIDVQVCASLLLSNCNVIHSNNALNISPSTGVTVPSVKATNCFFDTSVNGLNCTGAGSVLRCEFTNCWFSSMSANGINMQPAVGGQVNGITFINCDIYNNIGGTTQGINTNAQTGKWKMVGCSIAGWTTGINLVPGAAHFPTILGNSIGSISAFGVNTTGVVIGTGTYKGLVLAENDVVDNTTALTLGTVTVTAWGNYRIIDNAGINPRGSVGVIAVPATTVVKTNDTGFRILAVVKWAATAPTVLTINGVSCVLPLLNQQVAYTLEPGSTFAYTGTAPTWTWVAM